MDMDTFFKWGPVAILAILLLLPGFRRLFATLLKVIGLGSMVWAVRIFPFMGILIGIGLVWSMWITDQPWGHRPGWYDKGPFVQVDSLNHCIVGMKGGTVRLLYYFAQPETLIKVNGEWLYPDGMQCAAIVRPFRYQERNEYHEKFPWRHREIQMPEGCTAMRLIYSEQGPGVMPIVSPGMVDRLDTMEIAIENGVAVGKLRRVPGDAVKGR